MSNNLINLGIYKDVKAELAAAGKSIAEVEDVELEPSLGNGGLGRLASCFIDSMSTLGINGEGVGLNYHCGLFKQVFVDNQQEAEANYWIEKDSCLFQLISVMMCHLKISHLNLVLTVSMFWVINVTLKTI